MDKREEQWKAPSNHRSQQSEQGKPALGDIQALAAQLAFNFTGNAHEEWFELDKRGDSSLGGTFRNSTQGIAEAYGYLVRYRHSREKRLLGNSHGNESETQG